MGDEFIFPEASLLLKSISTLTFQFEVPSIVTMPPTQQLNESGNIIILYQ